MFSACCFTCLDRHGRLTRRDTEREGENDLQEKLNVRLFDKTLIQRRTTCRRRRREERLSRTLQRTKDEREREREVVADERKAMNTKRIEQTHEILRQDQGFQMLFCIRNATNATLIRPSGLESQHSSIVEQIIRVKRCSFQHGRITGRLNGLAE